MYILGACQCGAFHLLYGGRHPIEYNSHVLQSGKFLWIVLINVIFMIEEWQCLDERRRDAAFHCVYHGSLNTIFMTNKKTNNRINYKRIFLFNCYNCLDDLSLFHSTMSNRKLHLKSIGRNLNNLLYKRQNSMVVLEWFLRLLEYIWLNNSFIYIIMNRYYLCWHGEEELRLTYLSITWTNFECRKFMLTYIIN